MKSPNFRRSFGLVIVGLASTSSISPAAVTHSIGANFEGSNLGDSGYIPPDTMGAVGPNHFVELLNGRYAVYDKAGAELSASSLNAFWSSAGVTPTGGYAFDPRVAYDSGSGRWFATAVDNGGKANNFLVAVSNNSDPTGGWQAIKIDSDSDDSHWADFPTMGINQDSVVISANMFSLAGGSTNTAVLFIPKDELVSPSATLMPTYKLFEDVAASTTGFTPHAVTDLGTGTLSSTLLSDYMTPSGMLKTSTVTLTELATAGGFISVSPGNPPPTATQPGGVASLNTSDTRFGGSVIIQDFETSPGVFTDFLWAVQAIDVDGKSAIAWTRIDAATNLVAEQGIISDPSLAFFFPSIAVNNFGEIVIGFSASDASTFASAYAVVGEFTKEGTTFNTPFETKAGVATYLQLDGSGRNRWGDYSATTIDPNDEHSFWTIQEFVSAQNVWSTQITQINVAQFSAIPEVVSNVTLLSLGAAGLLTHRRRKPIA